MNWGQTLQRVWWGRARGLERRLLPPLLAPAALVYAFARVMHGLPWRLGWRRVQPLRAPVVVVGNLVVGGAGKTPVVIALVQALQAAGWRPAVVSRGYRPGRSAVERPVPVDEQTRAADCGDEPLLLQRRLQVPVWVGRQRAEAARALLQAHPEVDVVVSDDGLQHRALPRAFEILVFDARGVGNGRLLPAGPLREPLPRQVPPRSIVLYNAQQPSTALPGPCAARRLGAVTPLAQWWAGADPGPAALQRLRSGPVIAAAGIASPERFFELLESSGLRLERMPLPDHATLDPPPWPIGETPVVVTEKDAVKLDPRVDGNARVHVATLDFALPRSVVDAVLSALSQSV